MKLSMQPELDWQERLRGVILQERLIETAPSLGALERQRLPQPPRAVYLGVGLCTETDVSVAVPVDLLGILLPAERVRRAVGAEALVVVVADEHALGNGFRPDRVMKRAVETERLLCRLGTTLGLEQMQVMRASSFHGSTRYRRILAEVDLRAPHGLGRYFRRQVADVEHMHRVWGGVVKVGWVVSGSPRVQHRRDEMAFDTCFNSVVGDHVGFVYCKAGRTMDDRRPKASPYVVVDPSRRICVSPDEDVAGKLERARRHASTAAVNGVRKHVGAVARIYSRMVAALDGPVERRLQSIISSVFADQRSRWSTFCG